MVDSLNAHLATPLCGAPLIHARASESTGVAHPWFSCVTLRPPKYPHKAAVRHRRNTGQNLRIVIEQSGSNEFGRAIPYLVREHQGGKPLATIGRDPCTPRRGVGVGTGPHTTRGCLLHSHKANPIFQKVYTLSPLVQAAVKVAIMYTTPIQVLTFLAPFATIHSSPFR